MCLDGSRFCDECGTQLTPAESSLDNNGQSPSGSGKLEAVREEPRPVSVTSVGISPLPQEAEPKELSWEPVEPVEDLSKPQTARLIIERGPFANVEFLLTTEESTIGRWDADNGIFPEVDLDPHDPEAKVSRKHARIIRKDQNFFIEDVGSTNGTFVNRGRRLLPGTPQLLQDGDEIIVGKTFLRFNIL
jgi:hypothetical protein